MILNFVRYDMEKGKKGEYKIRLGRYSVISFSALFYRREGLSNKKYVELFFDAGKKAIGFVFKENKNGPSAKLSHSLGRATISGCSLIGGGLGLSAKEREKYNGAYVPEKINHDEYGEMFYIQLRQRSE